MGLGNSQYNAIMRIYNERQLKDKHEQDRRIEEVYAVIPAIRELEANIGSKAAACARRLLDGDKRARQDLKEEIADLKEQRQILLRAYGFPEDYMEMHYQCPQCQDTGYYEGKKCSCFKVEEMKLLYAQSNLENIIRRENFEAFSDQYYDDQQILPELGITVCSYMKQIKEFCENYARNFSLKKSNILFQGSIGVGKTYLSNCIAKELIDHYYSVIYLSATDLFHVFAQSVFERNEEEDMRDMYQHVLECDLLIIDDLGTELNNSFVSSQFFYCVNERLLRKNATIITTNLDMDHIRDRYTERVASRIICEYMITPLYGDDIRTKISLP